jgi:excisionase family DNA binding protein
MTDKTTELMTVREVAAEAQCHEQTVYWHIYQGNLRTFKIGGTRHLIRRSNALRLISDIRAGRISR